MDRTPVATAVDIPATIQTKFGGKSNDDAPSVPGLSALGELTGPGINVPITLATKPGHPFQLPALHEQGEYALQNIRLVGENGEFLQQAVPSFVVINVSDVLQTKVRVRQLTADELRERGITVDSRNYEVYEYTFIFGVDQSTVEIPYTVLIDKRTHVIEPVAGDPYKLPPLKSETPPRFTPPQTEVFDLGLAGPLPPASNELDKTPPVPPSIPAALVVPNGFGVLHQFFAVILQIDNAAPEGSEIRLDSVTAAIATPQQMRVSKVVPAVSIGRPVPIVDEVTGATFLVAGAKGSAEWTLEALSAGTHTIDIEVNATYHKPGQDDFPLRGHVSTALVVSDPRFHINFSHPDTVRKDEPYTAFAFVTNLSAQRQHVVLDTSDIPPCSSGGSSGNICRTTGSGVYERDIEAGEMVSVPYALTSRINGKVFAAAGAANDEALGVSVHLTMGVSASGIPLSPATLVMPYYTRFLPSAFVDAQMQLLGLGYSLATAPLNKFTALQPRVIKTDVFTRAQQIARAGQRTFITNPNPNHDAFPNLALDLLGNVERLDQLTITPELAEWDQLRRQESAGRSAAASMARELEKIATTPSTFVDTFAAATSHRAPFALAYVHGPNVSGTPRPYALSIAGVSSETLLDTQSEADAGNWTRTLPYAELTRLTIGDEPGELALIGRWKENLRVVVLPRSTAFTVNLLYPDTTDGALLRADIDITGATVGSRIVIELARGARTLTVQYATGVATIREVTQTPLTVSAAAQDLFLDATGHVVTLLFNRPVKLPANVTLRDRLALTINIPKANYSVVRRNTAGAELQIPGAAIQDDGRIVAVTFDKTLSRNANYEIALNSILDLVTSANFNASGIVPRIDNDRPGAILTGRVLRADNTPVPGVLVQLSMRDIPITAADGTTRPRDVVQWDVADVDGRFLYEFVPRDLDSGIFGLYDLETRSPEGVHTSLSGAVRLPGEVHTANLVFLGRGRARGQVRYDDGTPIPNVIVTIGSSLHVGLSLGVTDADGRYDIDGLPVAPLTFSVVDPDGRTTFAANHLRTPGEVLTQDLVVIRRTSPGKGIVRITVRRSDNNAPIVGADVGVATQGYPLQQAVTDVNGTYEFRDVPAGLVSMLAAAWNISRHSAAVELELRADQILEQTLVIQIADVTTKYTTLEGTITRDDPASPNDTSKDVLVPGAIVTVGNRPAVTADSDGTYQVLDLPVAPSGSSQGTIYVTVFDPATGRKGWFVLPTLAEGTNHFSMRLTSRQPDGVATMRARLYGPHSELVSNYRVIVPGYPPERLTEKSTGVYELANVPVPRDVTVFAVPVDANGVYGDQVTQGQLRVDFHGQIGVTDLRLPGSGTLVVRLEVEGACAGCPPTQAIGPVAVTYNVWDEASQGLYPKTVEFQPDATTGIITIPKIPARQDVRIATVRNPAGYAAATAYLAYDGDVRNVTLRMRTIGDVTGRVLSYDGITPISGATVRIVNSNANYAPSTTRPDGTFTFSAIPAATSLDLVAEITQDGIYRTGIVSGRTPDGGGPVSDLLITMREQATVEGKVVDGSGAVVPLARFWLRELSWPYRAIGTPHDPLFADIHGRFIVANIFTGAFRITAVHPGNQEIRGDYQGSLNAEGDATQRNVQVAIGGIGTGTISITVLDPLRGFVPVENAEVTLLRDDNRFDFTTTNENGVAFFDQVPAAGTYRAIAYSKALGRAGAGTNFTVASGQTAASSVQLEFRGLVTGTMTDPESEPPNQPVKGMPVTLTGALWTRDSTDETGAFEFDGVPEGEFTLFGYQTTSDRYAFGPSGLFISKLVPEQRNIHLELERTGTLTVKVYLPNDAGGPGELAPLAAVSACQCRESIGEYAYLRGAQGNPVVFTKMLRRREYSLTVTELGGEARTVKVNGGFGANEFAKEQIVVLPSSGSVEITVVDGAGNPVADAQVQINDRTMYTSANGVVSLSGLPFGWITVQARKGNVAASAGGDLHSRTQPLRLTLNLGTSVSVSGTVEAENGSGAPSPKTRVVATITSRLLPSAMRLETLTAADGTYGFTGIPVGGTTLALLFYGPDDTTIGASRTITVPDGATGTIAIPSVRLDATPPRVLSIDPPANSTNVSPSTQLTVTFSEPIAASFLSTNWFQLVATDNSAQVNLTFEASIRPDGTYIVKLTPPAPPAGQTFPLKSNVLYRFTIPQGLADTTGNTMRSAVGSSFTTVNYTEPDIVRVEPSIDAPLFVGTTFRVKFNKPVIVDSGFAVLERLDKHHGVAVEEIPVARSADPNDPSTFLIAPTGVAIAESSFYRLRIAEVRDTQTPANVQREVRTFDYFSFDTNKPTVSIASPLPPASTLVSGVLYTVTADVTDDGGSEAKDIAYVDWLDANGVALARRTTKPYAYSFTAPTTSTTFTLKASATDLSNNSSASVTKTWDVVANEAPRDITITNAPTSLYPGAAVETRVRFSDEGVAASVALELRGTNVDGSELRQIVGSQSATRTSTNVDFPELTFRWNAPLALKDGSATLVVTVTDSVNKSGTASSPLTILADTNAPVIVSLLPKAETRYRFGTTNNYTIELQTRDDETAIARATISVNGATVLDATSGIYDAATRVTTFRATVAVPPKNADTRVPIVVTAYDARGNMQTETRDVIYERVDDATLPTAAWLTPLDGAALPSNQSGWLTTLRIRATDDQQVTSVRFESTALAAPITLVNPKAGTTDIFEAKAALTMPSDGSSFVIKAIIADGDPSHDVELPITIDPVVAASTISGDINISSITADRYANKSIVVRGARVYITVPLTIKDLMLVDGATLSVSEETKLDVTITDRLFVDADSAIDVTGKGWLGGLARREDNSFTNPLRAGRTSVGTGAINANGSHAGIGGAYFGATNTTYGSITDPSDFGAGGAAQPDGNATGGNGGGAMHIVGGTGLARFVVAGRIAANGAFGAWSSAAGGSVDLRARALITSPLTRITANGADDDSIPNIDLGAGGGRIAARITDRFDAQPSQFIARGGRNGASPEGAHFIDGGAGTIYLVTPDATKTLIVSAFDDRYPSTTHRVMGTPIGSVDVDAIVIGPRTLARFDVAPAVAPTIDATATMLLPTHTPSITLKSTTPAANGNAITGTKIDALYDATSTVGIREVRAILDIQPNDNAAYPAFVATQTNAAIFANVPANATAGPATLKLQVRDRAGRIAETQPVAFTVVVNAAPIIDTFDVVPAIETYAGRTLNVSAAATDDVVVQSLTLATTSGTITANAPSTSANRMTRTFSVALLPTATPGANVTLTLTAADDHVTTTATKNIAVLHDTLPPSMTLVAPDANHEFDEAAGATFAIEVNATDAEVAVKRVVATFDGVDTNLTFANNAWRATIDIPNVDGTDPVAKTLVINAYDYEDNVASSTRTIFIKPLIDPNAPTLNWVCGSAGAIAPTGLAVPFRVSAIPANGANGVQSVSIAIGTDAPIAMSSVGANVYQSTFIIPAGTTDGTTLPIRVIARTVSGIESTLLGTLTAVTGITINTTSTITANDSAFENQSLIVTSGGTLTITGPHHFRNLVVLDGGRVIQKHVDAMSADALDVQRLFIACNATLDVAGLGLARNSGYTGSSAADDGSGGSHIGRGATITRSSAGAFGNIFEPREPGSGGNHPASAVDASASGGGMVRIRATGSVAIDGAINANGIPSTYGGGAGGSIWIESAGAFTGSGSLDASGANASLGGGGGGAIALRASTFSGTLRTSAFGGISTQSRHGAAGTVARNDDVFIDNRNTAQHSATELPSFGRATITGVAANVVTLDRRFVSPSLVGHRVRANGITYRIAAIANDALTFDGSITAPTQDSVAYDGYLLYSPQGVGIDRRRVVAVRRSGSTWQYDTDTSFSTFTPASDDVLFATFTKDAQRITSLQRLTCTNTCGAIDGINVAELISGELAPNMRSSTNAGGPNTLIGTRDAAEILLRGDGDGRALVFSRGIASTLTLEALNGATSMPHANDTLRGVHLFRNLTLANARVITEDLVEVNTLTKDAASSLATGNVDAPVIDATKITIARGRNGAVVIGTTGAITDIDTPLEVIATNTSAAAHAPITLEVANAILVGNDGGLSLRHAEGIVAGEAAHSLESITNSGYVAFTVSANTNVQVALAPAFTTDSYAEPQHDSFRFFANGTYEVFANATATGKTGAYDATTAFRIEKTTTSIRWFVDDVEVHALTANVPPSLLLHVSFENATSGEVSSLEFITDGLPRDSYHAKVASDGSFRVPIAGNAGDAIAVRARDRHFASLASKSVAIGTIPNDVGVASITFDAPEVTGGRTAIATITLNAPASSDGARVRIAFTGMNASMPDLVIVPSGATSTTFTINTTAVLAPTNVVITATHGSVGATNTLAIVRDAIAPSIALNTPSANAVFIEHSQVTSTVTATDADSGVKRVYATFDGQTIEYTKSGNTWSGTLTMPYVEGTQDVTRALVVTAVDNSDNVASTNPIDVIVRPIVDSATPTVAWSCGSDGVMVAVNTSAIVRIVARAPNATNVLQSVELFVTAPNGAVTSYPTTLVATDTYEAIVPIGDVADRSAFTTRALVTAISGTTAEVTATFTAVRGAFEVRSNTTISAGDASKDSGSIVVFPGATLTIDGTHTFDRIVVARNARLVPLAGNALALNANSVFIACDALVDANESGSLQSTTTASHLGRSGGVTTTGGTFGSVTRPRELGATAFKSGGGAVRIQSQLLVVDGAIRANGGDGGSFNAAGAGGSLWLQTQTIRGTGSIAAEGGFGCHDGGGGAIAIEYTNASSTLPTRSAIARGSACNANGGAGVVFVKGPASTYGSASIDALALGTTELPSLGVGSAQPGTTANTLVTDRATNIPSYFEGHWVEIANKGTWRIATINAKTVTLAPNGNETITLAAGDTWRGVHRFDTLRLRNTTLLSGDRIDYATLDKDAASTLVTNTSAPQLDAAKITLRSTTAAVEVLGTAGAVTDPDTPITLIATNTRTSQTFTATANADGSFAVAVGGISGDTFTLRARDGHTLPMTSQSINVAGAIEDLNPMTSFTVTPSSVVAGTNTIGTIRLTAPARTGGITIALTSSNASIATIPSTITIAAGTTSTQFVITTIAAGQTTITATGHNTFTATLAVTTATTGLTSLALDTASIVGGTSTNASVTLGAPAPAGGAKIVLSTSDTSRAVVPSSVTIAQGATTASFTIQTAAVGATSNVTIFATYDVTRSATLALTACSALGTASQPSTVASNIWFDDAPPANATITGTPAFDNTQSARGTQSLHFTAATGARSWSFTNAAPLTVAPTDVLELQALINPCNPPRQILITWNTTLRASWGDDLMNGTTATRIAPLPTGNSATGNPATVTGNSATWSRLTATARSLGITTTTNITSFTISVFDGEAWFDTPGTSSCSFATATPPALGPNDTLWFDDALPTGASAEPPSGQIGAFTFDTSQSASGTKAHHTNAANGTHQHSFTGATQKLAVNTGDSLFAYVLLDPCNPPKQVMLVWRTGNDFLHRAYWGENLILTGTSGAANQRIGPLPQPGVWTRLEVPASMIGAEGLSFDGMGFVLYDGHAWFDAPGKATRVNLALNKPSRQSSVEFGFTAARANDGDVSTFSHTQADFQPFWEVDLGAIEPLDSIEILHRMECCETRHADFWILVSESPMTSTTVDGARAQGARAYRHRGMAGARTETRLRTRGRYVRFQLASSSDAVNPREIRVYGPSTSMVMNLASGNTSTSQSSNFDPALASENAVNGDVVSLWTNEFSMAHTQTQTNARFDIDLGRVEAISNIHLYNRLDSATDAPALANLYVFVSDVPFASTNPATTLTQSTVSPFFLGTWRWIHSIPVNRTGRYVRVQFPGTGTLVMSEIEIESQQLQLAPVAKPLPEK